MSMMDYGITELKMAYDSLDTLFIDRALDHWIWNKPQDMTQGLLQSQKDRSTRSCNQTKTVSRL